VTLDWPFEDPPNSATFTLRQIVQGVRPILLVVHDVEDGGWQFLDGHAVDIADALLVSMRSMVERDPTTKELADLPHGWRAWRATPTEAWQREEMQPGENDADGKN
jgi:hypothetical protein